MTLTVLVYDPTAPAASDNHHVARLLGRLHGKTVGFIDNAKPNFNHLVDDLGELLVQHHGVAGIIKHAKRGPSMPAARDALDELAGQCDLVIAGSGD